MAKPRKNLISIEEARTLDGLFAERVRRSPDKPAYQYHSRRDKAWKTYSWAEMANAVARWQVALRAEGLVAGDRVAVLLRNCPDWIVFDQAALSLGLVTVPLYNDDRPDNIAYVLEDSGARLLFAQDVGRWQRLASALSADGPLQRVVVNDAGHAGAENPPDDPRVRQAADWLPGQAGELEVRSDADPHALGSIVYTSGTTGRPKGVMLSHHNMLYVAQASLELIDCFEDDVFLSFLPLSHTLERTGGYYLPMLAGATVAFARSVPQLAEDLKTVRPTALIAVPRIFERVYGRVVEQMDKKSWLARKLFEVTINVGWRRFQHAQGRGGWSPSLLLWPLLERLVARKITAALGGRLRLAVSGGAALAPGIARTFLGLGVPIIQGYGLTETSPVVSVNVLEDNVPESVGVALPGTEVRIGDNDELLVKGPGVMHGYWNRPDDTAKVIGPGGWLRTGDQARIGEGGHIHLTGRIKDILVLSNGEKIPPADMELAIAVDPLVDQVMVVGEGRPYLSALVVLNEAQWFVAAQQLGLNPEDPASLGKDSVRDLVLKRIRQALRGFPGYAKIRRVCLSLDPWAIEDGLLTPTLKVKRPKVLEKYAREVDEMYASGPAA